MAKKFEETLEKASTPELLIILLAVIGIAVGIELLSTVILWGICSFIIWAFGISFTFTFWHGLALSFIISILASIFRSK